MINVKKIDKVLKADEKAGKLIQGALAELDTSVAGYDYGNEPAPTCKNVGRCAVGALLIAAGYPVAKLMQSPAELTPTSNAAKLLKKEYGLVPDISSMIEYVNDTTNLDNIFQGVMGFVEFAAFAESMGLDPVSIRIGYEDGFDTYEYEQDDLNVI